MSQVMETQTFKFFDKKANSALLWLLSILHSSESLLWSRDTFSNSYIELAFQLHKKRCVLTVLKKLSVGSRIAGVKVAVLKMWKILSSNSCFSNTFPTNRF